jgi:hypothetical protein
VDDDAWEETETIDLAELPGRDEQDDKTIQREVPTFRVPARLRVDRALAPRTPSPRVASSRGGRAGSAVVHAPAPVKVAAAPPPKRRRGWRIAMLSTAVVVALAAVGATHGKSWLPRLERVVGSHLMTPTAPGP